MTLMKYDAFCAGKVITWNVALSSSGIQRNSARLAGATLFHISRSIFNLCVSGHRPVSYNGFSDPGNSGGFSPNHTFFNFTHVNGARISSRI